MKRNRIVLIVISLILTFTYSAMAFTVVLKSGKTIEGTWVSESSNSISIKDSNGVILSFQKHTLDMKAMKAAAGAGSAPSDSRASADIPSTIAIPNSQPPMQPIRTQSKEQRRWNVDMTLENAYDSNINHDPDQDAVEAVGVIYGMEGNFRNRVHNPSFEVSYGIARHQYSQTDKWNRISHDLVVSYSHEFTHSLSFEPEAEISLKGSSEDRELSNNYILEPHLMYRMNRGNRLDIYGAYRLKRYSDTPERNATSPYGGFEIDHWLGKHRVDFGIRYERNTTVDEKYTYYRYTYMTEYSFPFARHNRFSVSAKYKPQHYTNRLVQVGDDEVLRSDRRWIFEVNSIIALSEHFYLLPGYKYETRDSNDPDKLFDAHLPTLALRYHW